MTTYTKKFDFTEELHQTVIKSLATSFGLEFLLFKDEKDGGNVNTIHNVRNNVYATDTEKNRYDHRGNYNSHDYHSHQNYVDINRQGKRLKESGQLVDSYTSKTFSKDSKTDLDHVISAKNIHDDAGRVLAGIDGEDIANRDSNLVHTNPTINRSKRQQEMPEFINRLQSESAKRKIEIAQLEEKTNLEPQESKRLQSLKAKEYADYKKMQEIDKKSRAAYEMEVNYTYYTSSKFAKELGTTSLKTGISMGTRQMLGLILAEAWFELKDNIPELLKKHKSNFILAEFLADIGQTFRNIFERVKQKFSQFISAFKDGTIAGILSNITTTVLNIFMTTKRVFMRMIREIFSKIVEAAKLIFFNPQNLNFSELTKQVLKILAAGVAVCVGVFINTQLSTIFTFPFGPEISAFLSALVTGLITIGCGYFLEHSSLMKKVWDFLDKFKDKFARSLDFYKDVNDKLNTFLYKIAEIEFNLNTSELKIFSAQLKQKSTELERFYILKEHVKSKNIKLGFDIDDNNDFVRFLNSL